MRLINIVDNLLPVNIGIWQAAISNAEELARHHGVFSQLWYCEAIHKIPENQFLKNIPLKDISSNKMLQVEKLLNSENLNPEQDIIITHGCWRTPTILGSQFAKKGFLWMYVPHGLLEPNEIKRNPIKKSIYFRTIELPLSKKATIVRAVGTPEQKNLEKYYKSVVHIPNGTPIVSLNLDKKKNFFQIRCIFLSRLHHKKNVLPLTKAWVKSSLFNNNRFKFIICGPDDGELASLQHYLASLPQGSNIEYVGPIYGEEKKEILSTGHFYLLPSNSEGFSTSVVEAMQYGLIPVISSGCNFPEVFDNRLAIKTGIKESDIKKSLQSIADISEDDILKHGMLCREYITGKFSLKEIASQLIDTLEPLLD